MCLFDILIRFNFGLCSLRSKPGSYRTREHPISGKDTARFPAANVFMLTSFTVAESEIEMIHGSGSDAMFVQQLITTAALEIPEPYPPSSGIALGTMLCT